MSNAFEIQAANLLLPGDDMIAVVAVTTSSQELDLTSRDELSDHKLMGGRFVTLIANVDIYINFGATSSGSVNETATSGATQGWLLPANTPLHGVPKDAQSYLRYKGTAAGYLRMYVSSRMPTEDV